MADKPVIADLTSNSISASDINSRVDDLADAVEGCLGRGGTGENPNSMTGTLDMDGNKLQNLSAPTADDDAVRLTDLTAITEGTEVATLRTDLGATTSGKGASLIGVEDSGANFTGTDVEAVLAEIQADVDQNESDADTAIAALETGHDHSDAVDQGGLLSSATMEAMGWYYGVVTDTVGTPSISEGPSGWTITDNSEGNYTITHNLANSGSTIFLATAIKDKAMNVTVQAITTNDITVEITNMGDVVKDASFSFLLIDYS